MDTKSTASKILLTEGRYDAYAIHHIYWLLKGRDPDFGFFECGSDDGALDELSGRLISSVSTHRAIGIVLDCDIDGVSPEVVVKARFDQIRRRASSFYTLPDFFPKEGLVAEPNNGWGFGKCQTTLNLGCLKIFYVNRSPKSITLIQPTLFKRQKAMV